MVILLNGKAVEIQAGMSISGLLALKGLEPGKVIVEHNHEIVRREEWEKTMLRDNDEIEVLRFVGGG